jgi:hypothetical protein
MSNKISLTHPIVDNAYKNLLKENPEHANLNFTDIVKLFENKYKCKIGYADEYGIYGSLVFNDEKALSWFLLQNSDEHTDT